MPWRGGDSVSQQELEELCREWQRILRVQDWDVKVRFARVFEIDGADGRTSYQRSTKTANIRICDLGDEDKSRAHLQDAEQTLVHELLHLHHAGIDDFTGAANMVFEQAIDLTAWALVNLKRGGR